jgi:hypothetical protein
MPAILCTEFETATNQKKLMENAVNCICKYIKVVCDGCGHIIMWGRVMHAWGGMTCRGMSCIIGSYQHLAALWNELIDL